MSIYQICRNLEREGGVREKRHRDSNRSNALEVKFFGGAWILGHWKKGRGPQRRTPRSLTECPGHGETLVIPLSGALHASPGEGKNNLLEKEEGPSDGPFHGARLGKHWVGGHEFFRDRGGRSFSKRD